MGTGKSTIKELYLSGLKDDMSKDGKGRTRAKRIRLIIFNAWRFGGENIKRALLRQVFLALGGDESHLTNALFRQIQRAVTEKRSWRAILRDAADKWVWSLPQVVFVYLLIFLLLYLVRTMFGLSGE